MPVSSRRTATMKPVRLLCALVLLGTSPLAMAQAYKCSVDGHTTYQDQPCPAGGGTKMDLPGAYAPPPLAGGAVGNYAPQDLAMGLAFNKVMQERCPLGPASASRLALLEGALLPLLRPVSQAQLVQIDQKAHQAANGLLAGPNRALACKFVEAKIDEAHGQLQQARSRGSRGPKPTL